MVDTAGGLILAKTGNHELILAPNGDMFWTNWWYDVGGNFHILRFIPAYGRWM
jgi:hypothetical protein